MKYLPKFPKQTSKAKEGAVSQEGVIDVSLVHKSVHCRKSAVCGLQYTLRDQYYNNNTIEIQSVSKYILLKFKQML